MKKDLMRYVFQLVSSGDWEIKSGKHIKLKHITGKILCTSKTPSDIRTLKNFQHEVSRFLKSLERNLV